MTEIRPFRLSDFESVVNMYYDFIMEIYPNRKTGDKYFFYKAVERWINQKADIVVSLVNKEISGFSMCYLDDFGGLTEAIYQCDTCYVKDSFRNGRSAYMLYNNGYSYAKDKSLTISVGARVEYGVNKLVADHFDLIETFKTYEG